MAIVVVGGARAGFASLAATALIMARVTRKTSMEPTPAAVFLPSHIFRPKQREGAAAAAAAAAAGGGGARVPPPASAARGGGAASGGSLLPSRQ